MVRACLIAAAISATVGVLFVGMLFALGLYPAQPSPLSSPNLLMPMTSVPRRRRITVRN